MSNLCHFNFVQIFSLITTFYKNASTQCKQEMSGINPQTNVSTSIKKVLEKI